MRGILADINVEGIVTHLHHIWLSATWREFWFGLGLSVEDLGTMSLPLDESDAVIWRMCQAQQLVLVTGNRNADGPDSLDVTIQAENQPDSLPVITLADARPVLRERDYAERVAVRILDYLMRIDELRGSGRLYAL